MTENKLVKQFLENHGITDKNKHQLLDMTWDEIPSGSLLKNADKFCTEVIKSVKNDERICVVGDYDTDGVMSTVIAVRSLQELNKYLGTNAKISYFINHRFKDGYGISKQSIDKVLLKNPKLDTIVTVDNGIVAFDAVDYAKLKGIKILVTDHHKSLDTVPDADVLVDPTQPNDNYPFKGISGSTVIWKLMQNLAKTYYPELTHTINSFVDFVGMSVVSDVMPMLQENRVYVKRALKIFNDEDADFKNRFGWVALKEVLVRNKKLQKDKHIDEQDFGFLFSPIVNAQSRVTGEANMGVELFTSKNTTHIREIAEFMVDTNEKRKELSNGATEEILHNNDFSNLPIIIVRKDDLGDGIIGLVASKLTEKYNRPSIVFCKSDNGVLKGSGRSIDGIDITDACRKFSDLCLALGGHSQANGMSIKEENYDIFKEKLTDYMSTIVPEDLSNEVNAEIELDVHKITFDLLNEFNHYAPFGNSFEFPIFKVTGIDINKVQRLGKNKAHIKILADDLDILSWNPSEEFVDKASQASRADITGTLSINEFRGKKTLQLIVSNETAKFYD